jgi:hypothetical protein
MSSHYHGSDSLVASNIHDMTSRQVSSPLLEKFRLLLNRAAARLRRPSGMLFVSALASICLFIYLCSRLKTRYDRLHAISNPTVLNTPSSKYSTEEFHPFRHHAAHHYPSALSFFDKSMMKENKAYWLPWSSQEVSSQKMLRAIVPIPKSPIFDIPDIYLLQNLSPKNYILNSYFYTSFNGLVTGLQSLELDYNGNVPNIPIPAITSTGHDAASFLNEHLAYKDGSFHPILHLRIEWPSARFSLPKSDRSFIKDETLLHIYKKDLANVPLHLEHFILQGGSIGSFLDIFVQLDYTQATHPYNPQYYQKMAACLAAQFRHLLDNISSDDAATIHPLCLSYVEKSTGFLCLPNNILNLTVKGPLKYTLHDQVNLHEWKSLFLEYFKMASKAPLIYKLEIASLQTAFKALTLPEQVFLALSSSFQVEILKYIYFIHDYPVEVRLDILRRSLSSIPTDAEFSKLLHDALDEIFQESCKLLASDADNDHVVIGQHDSMDMTYQTIASLPYLTGFETATSPSKI